MEVFLEHCISRKKADLKSAVFSYETFFMTGICNLKLGLLLYAKLDEVEIITKMGLMTDISAFDHRP